MIDAMNTVDSEPLWSILDQKGTQTMMRQILGEAGSVADYDSVRKRLVGSWYTMNFQHGVQLRSDHLDGRLVCGSYSFVAAECGCALPAMSGSDTEKAALAATDISSSAGKLAVHFAVFRLGVRHAAQVAIVPKHGSLTRQCGACERRAFFLLSVSSCLGGVLLAFMVIAVDDAVPSIPLGCVQRFIGFLNEGG